MRKSPLVSLAVVETHQRLCTLRNANQDHIDDSADITDNGIRCHAECAHNINDRKIKRERNGGQAELHKKGSKAVARDPFDVRKMKGGLSDPESALLAGKVGHIKGKFHQHPNAVCYGGRFNPVMKNQNKDDVEGSVNDGTGRSLGASSLRTKTESEQTII